LQADWDPVPPPRGDGHRTHACGTDIDIDDQAINTNRRGLRTVDIDQPDLASIVNQHFTGAFVFNEGNHVHIHFADCT